MLPDCLSLHKSMTEDTADAATGHCTVGLITVTVASGECFAVWTTDKVGFGVH